MSGEDIIVGIIMVVAGLLFLAIIAGIAVIANKVRGKYSQKVGVSNESAKFATNEQPKSPIVGFVLSLFLGWLGADRFYMGGTKSIVFGVIKIVCGVIIFLGCIVFYRPLIFSGQNAIYAMIIVLFVYVVLYFADLIYVPCEIISNNRKIANVPNNPTALKDFGKYFLSFAVVFGILILSYFVHKVLIELLRLDILDKVKW